MLKLEYSTDRLEKKKIWKRNRDQAAGADAAKANAREYVAQRKSLSPEDYDSIMAGAEYFPMAARTLQSFVGLVFRKAPTFDGSDGFPEAISSDGHTPEEFVRLQLREYMVVNDGGILLDAPDTPKGATDAAIAKMKLFAYQTFYKAESIREIRYKAINGYKKLVYVRLVEDDDNGRELELINGVYQATVWNRTDANGWRKTVIVPKARGVVLDEIPFIYLGDDDDGSAMDDLCATNVTHFNKSFLLSQAALWVSAPVMVVAGVDEDVELENSPGAFWRFEDASTQWGFNEYKGDGVPLIERELDRLEAHSSMLGSRMLIQEKSVSEAEGTVARRQAGENSILASMARHISSRSTKAFKLQAKMMGLDPTPVRYTLSTDFIPGHADPALVGQLLALRVANKIPQEALFEALQRLDIINESWDYEQYEAALDIQSGSDGTMLN